MLEKQLKQPKNTVSSIKKNYNNDWKRTSHENKRKQTVQKSDRMKKKKKKRCSEVS